MSWLFLLLASLAWVLFDFCRKRLVENNSPLLVSFVFSLFTLPVYLVFWLATDSSQLPQVMVYYVFASLSALLAALGAVAFISALGRGRFSILLPMLALTPLIAALLNAVVFSNILNWQAYTIIGICAYATYRLLGEGFAITEPGAGFMLLAAFSWAGCICLDQFVLSHASVSFHALWVNVIMVLVLFCSLVTRRKRALLPKGRKIYWAIGLCGFAAAVLLQFSALRYLDASIVEAVKRAIGIVAAMIVGSVFLREKLKPYQYVYGVIIIFSVLIFSFVTE